MVRFATRHVLAATLGAAAAATIREAQNDLGALADSLKFRGSVYATYSAVLPRAIQAYDTISALVNDTGLAPQAPTIRSSLARLITESSYFVTESLQPGFEPDPLESDSYLTASVTEWSYTVKVLSNNIATPVCDIRSNLPPAQACTISSDAAPGTEFRDNALTPRMIVIPTGSFTAGATDDEHVRWDIDEGKKPFEIPQRQVSISKKLAFSVTEVTVAEFDAFIQATCYQLRNGARWWNPQNVSQFVFNDALSYRNPGFPQGPDHPVVAITRYDAQAYAQWLSAITGAVYRLPNEDEWEWAARGGTQTTFFWGNDLPPAAEYANTYDDTAAAVNRFRWPSNHLVDPFPYTAPVASFKPNGYGLYDVIGNAREFTADDWQKNLSTAARDGSIHKGPAPFPVVRGGAWNYNPDNLRINYRSGYLSSEVATNMFGIRVVRDL
ncbi:hypothetical protein V2G26_001548 [Clonostachys chloroleuca]